MNRARSARVAIMALVALAGCATSDPIGPLGGGGDGGAGATASTSSGAASTKASSAVSSASGQGSSSTGGSSCGDGVVEPGEECDDGNGATGDGCSACVVDCETGAQKYAANHHCYRVFATPGAEASARTACEAWGGATGLAQLVSISDAGEQTFVMGLVTQPGWMGGGDAATEAQYAWYDGTPFAYTHWAPNEPNDPGHVENCIFMQTAGGWDDHDCAMMQPSYICERRAAGAP